MVDQPQTHYAKGPGGNIAHQVVGDGPMDLVIVRPHGRSRWVAVIRPGGLSRSCGGCADRRPAVL